MSDTFVICHDCEQEGVEGASWKCQSCAIVCTEKKKRRFPTTKDAFRVMEEEGKKCGSATQKMGESDAFVEVCVFCGNADMEIEEWRCLNCKRVAPADDEHWVIQFVEYGEQE